MPVPWLSGLIVPLKVTGGKPGGKTQLPFTPAKLPAWLAGPLLTAPDEVDGSIVPTFNPTKPPAKLPPPLPVTFPLDVESMIDPILMPAKPPR